MLQTLSQLAARELFQGFSGRIIHTERMTLIYWDIREGATLPAHSHPHEQVVNVFTGEFALTVDGVEQILKAGDVFAIAPGAVHLGKAITACYILDVFCPVREDYSPSDSAS